MNNEEAIAQQRNVAYVGMTRAMHQLAIVYNGRISQFVEEMDPNLYSAREFADAVEFSLKEPTAPYKKRELPMEDGKEKTDHSEKKRRWSF